MHICWSRGYYIGQVRGRGCRKYEDVTGKCRSVEGAIAKAARRYRNNHRLRVLFVDSSGWYGPNVMFEGKR